MVISDTQKIEAMQHDAILATIRTVMELPSEKPSIVTITDREKLQNQTFFQKAENGDKIIIYEDAKRVILYRPKTKKIVDVAPLVFNAPTQSEIEFIPQIVPSPGLDLLPVSEGTSAGAATSSGLGNVK